MKKQYTSSNIKFLMQGLGLDTVQLSDRIGLEHPIELTRLETNGATSPHHCQETLIAIANYFNIYWRDMIACNLSKPGNLNPNTFPGLIRELSGGKPYKRLSLNEPFKQALKSFQSHKQ